MQNGNENFVRERKNLNSIISFFENFLNIKESRTFSERIEVTFDVEYLLKQLYSLYTVLAIADLTNNQNLVNYIKNNLEFIFDLACLEFINNSKIDSSIVEEIFKCFFKRKNTVIFSLRKNSSLLINIGFTFEKKNLSQSSSTFSSERKAYISTTKTTKEVDKKIYIYTTNILDISNNRINPELEDTLNFLFQKAIHSLFNDKNIIYNINSYISSISNRLKELKDLKTEIEEFLANKVLKKVSKRYTYKAFWLSFTWFLFFVFSLILIFTPLLFIPNLLDGKTWHDILIKASIGFIPIVVGFYLLRYSLKLRDLQEEYKFKSIMLSSLPALSLLIDDKNERDKIITTILLEASNLQTLTKDKGEVVKEILPIVELANKLKNS